MNKRMRWIDVVKGVGIILVIIGHSACPQLLLKYIQSFHMPLFFIVAGYLFNEYPSTEKLIKRKSTALIKPYLIYGVFNFTVTIIRLAINGGINTELFRTAFRYAIGLVYSRGTWYWMPNCSPIWFLTAMFVALILFNYLVKLVSPTDYLMAMVSLLLACFFCHIDLIKLPWNIDTALWAQPYMLLGYKLKRLDLPEIVNDNRYLFSIAAVGLIVVGSLAAFGNSVPYISMDSMIMGNYLLMLASSLSLSMALILICILFMPTNRLLELFGRNTVTVLGLNYLVNTIVYYLWSVLLPNSHSSITWIEQCFLQIIILGLFVLLSDYRKTRFTVKDAGGN